MECCQRVSAIQKYRSHIHFGGWHSLIFVFTASTPRETAEAGFDTCRAFLATFYFAHLRFAALLRRLSTGSALAEVTGSVVLTSTQGTDYVHSCLIASGSTVRGFHTEVLHTCLLLLLTSQVQNAMSTTMQWCFIVSLDPVHQIIAVPRHSGEGLCIARIAHPRLTRDSEIAPACSPLPPFHSFLLAAHRPCHMRASHPITLKHHYTSYHYCGSRGSERPGGTGWLRRRCGQARV